MNFNPRAPCGARHRLMIIPMKKQYFNPRAPCGARQLLFAVGGCVKKFQPTRPLRGATILCARPVVFIYISTHAPLAGRDDRGGLRCKLRSYFNPRAPCGARRYPEIKQLGYGPRFQPTRPLRGATTQVLLDMMQRTIFQPTRPLRGATPVLRANFTARAYFNPRAPCGARRQDLIRKSG